MSPRTAAWWWLGALTLVALVVTLLLTPWGTVVAAPDGLVRSAFGAEKIARGNAFASEIRPATYGSMVLGVLVALWLGLTRLGLRLVRAGASWLRWWWLQVFGAVAVVTLVVWAVTLPLDVWNEMVLRRWGLSTQDWGGWLVDEAKSLGLTVVLVGIGLVLLVGVAKLMPFWWFVPASLSAGALVFVMSFVYPVV
ncbi:MAG: hypothetical protein ACRDOJ_13525, partial [Nocardioidaceae bacterium]